MDIENALRPEERVSAKLRAMYQSWGYALYKVNRFEDYDLYMHNKSFLTDDRVLAFSDTDGKLMALKPDITLSVVKNTRQEDLPVRICYAESVYRVPRGAVGFREIMQTGIEAIGELGSWGACEVLLLAAKSLALINPAGWQLDVSDMSILGTILNGMNLSGEQRSGILKTISERNLHGLSELCGLYGVPEDTESLLRNLVESEGPLLMALDTVEKLPLPESCRVSLKGLREMAKAAKAIGLDCIHLDFSVVNDMSYYNGLIFSGFVDRIPVSVLSGGQYDPLMNRMGKQGQAIGFAVYMDQLGRLQTAEASVPETVSLDINGMSAADIAVQMEHLSSEGKRVRSMEAEA